MILYLIFFDLLSEILDQNLFGLHPNGAVVFEGTIEGVAKVGHGLHQGAVRIKEQAVGFGQGHGRRPWLVEEEAIGGRSKEKIRARQGRSESLQSRHTTRVPCGDQIGR